ncbi:ATP-binding protein [Clostridia bacterium]|nr:ATP-binding protein [Clostridia bacterium]
MEKLNTLTVYRKLVTDKLIQDMQDGLNGDENAVYNVSARLLEIEGGISPSEYLARRLVLSKNSYTLACEKEQSFPHWEMLLRDLKLIQAFIVRALKELPISASLLCPATTRYGKVEKELLNGTTESLAQAIREYVAKHGTGVLGSASAFVYQEKLRPVQNIVQVSLDDLLGFEEEKHILCMNTEAFLEGKKALNALLYGERGTGKSSTIKAILNRYKDAGLKMIEVDKENLKHLKYLLELLRNRGGKYILFLDDLSFENYENDYKSLKALMQGELEEKTDNILVYATSNRRHFIREDWSDRMDEMGEIHKSDSMEEKLSLVDRFGILLTFQRLNKKEYLEMVRFMSSRKGLTIEDEELIREALQWEISGHGMSGRSAEQLMISLLMREERA